jgi:hypothetical protein
MKYFFKRSRFIVGEVEQRDGIAFSLRFFPMIPFYRHPTLLDGAFLSLNHAAF